MRSSIVVVAMLLLVAACAADEPTATINPTGTSTAPTQTTTTATASTTTAPTTTTTVMATTTTAAPSPTAATTTTAAVTTDPYLPTALDRSAVPWGDVGKGWYVVLYDSSKAAPVDSSDIREGPVVLYLVEAAGDRYEVASWQASDRPWELVDARGTSALIGATGATLDDREWAVVDMTTGVTSLVHAAGFPEYTYSFGWPVTLTRPTGANVVVYQSDGTDEWLERRSPGGSLLATVYQQPYLDADSSLRWLYGYGGTSMLVMHHGGIAAVSNSGTLLQELWVPPDHRCEPVRWWDADTYLAVCYGQGPASAPIDSDGNPHTYYGRLWLLETDGTAGVPMTEYPAAPPIVVDFGYHDAWPTTAETYLQWSGDCGASAVATLQPDGTGAFLPIVVPASIVADGVAMVDIVGSQMAVYGWQGCGADVGALYATDLAGAYLYDLVPVVGDARAVIGVVGLATVYP